VKHHFRIRVTHLIDEQRMHACIGGRQYDQSINSINESIAQKQYGIG